MPFAVNGRISQDYIDGGLEISQSQYDEALEAMLEGKVITIVGGFNIIDPASPVEVPPKPEDPREVWKRERDLAVSMIVVTTANGNAFDGDEVSQSRMARAIIGLQSQPEGATVRWVLHDNSPLDVGVDELTEALTLAGLRQTELWVMD